MTQDEQAILRLSPQDEQAILRLSPEDRKLILTFCQTRVVLHDAKKALCRAERDLVMHQKHLVTRQQEFDVAKAELLSVLKGT